MKIVLIALIVVLLLSAWLFPSAMPALALVLLLGRLGMAFFVPNAPERLSARPDHACKVCAQYWPGYLGHSAGGHPGNLIYPLP